MDLIKIEDRIRKEFTEEMIDLLGSGFVDSYYTSAAAPFIMMAMSEVKLAIKQTKKEYGYKRTKFEAKNVENG